MARYLIGLASVVLLATTGCSLLIDTDESRLAADGGSGGGCVPVDCDDNVDCTTDRCVDGSCEHELEQSVCDSGERCDVVAGCISTQCSGDQDCDDGDPCNGVESCTGQGCVSGDPIVCDDGLACTADSCDAGQCQYEPVHTACTYDDLCVDGVCGQHAEADARGCRPTAKACDDDDGCTVDACNPVTGECESGKVDEDGDGVAAVSATCQEGDCDDSNASIFPDAPEYCNGRDESCNGRSDEMCESIPTTCSAAEEISLGVGETRTLEFNVDRFTSSYVTSCHGPSKPNGPDAVFRINVDSLMDVRIESSESDFDTILVTSETGCSQNIFGRSICDDDSPGANPLGSRIWRQFTGDFYLLVDSVEGASGNAKITITTTRTTTNACGSGIDISAGGTWIGQSRERALYQGSCGGRDGSEGVARLTAQATGTARIEVIALDADFKDPALYLTNHTCNIPIACENELPLVLEPALEDAESYVLLMDGAESRARFAVKYTPP